MTPLLQVEKVSRRFAAGRAHMFGARRTVAAVTAASLWIAPGETLGLVGESGSGKSTLGRIAAGLLSPSDGRVLFEGRDVAQHDRRTLSRRVQIVFQDALGALNPRLSIGRQLREPLDIHGIGSAVPVSATCSPWSGWMPGWRPATRTSSRAGSASAWWWRAPWRSIPPC
jgi:ABC-type glutathione transport system ATPase component